MSLHIVDLINGKGGQVVVGNLERGLSVVDLLNLLVLRGEDADSHVVFVISIVRDAMLGKMVGEFGLVDLFLVVNEEDLNNRWGDAENAQCFS
jgi:hypothetical protein